MFGAVTSWTDREVDQYDTLLVGVGGTSSKVPTGLKRGPSDL